MDQVRMVFGKWGGGPHWEFDSVRLGEDRHGVWLGVPAGTLMTRPGATYRTPVHQVTLLPEAPYVASFYAEGGSDPGPCEVYVDISTVPAVGEDTATAVDLDLDVVRGWTGRVWVDDEDEFADHRVRLGYPREVVGLAVSSCEAVRLALGSGVPPFDRVTAQRWLGDLAGVVTT